MTELAELSDVHFSPETYLTVYAPSSGLLLRLKPGAGEMIQWVKVLATKPNGLNSVP